MVPAAFEDYTTGKVLTTEYVPGRKVTNVTPVSRTELQGARLADQLFRAYLQQILVDGFVHADPHPGNVFLTDDNRIALLDLGMVARIAPGMQEKLLQLLLAVSERPARRGGRHRGGHRPEAGGLRRGRLPPPSGGPHRAPTRTRGWRTCRWAGPCSCCARPVANAASGCHPS